jgi:hypothetical protein
VDGAFAEEYDGFGEEGVRYPWFGDVHVGPCLRLFFFFISSKMICPPGLQTWNVS